MWSLCYVSGPDGPSGRPVSHTLHSGVTKLGATHCGNYFSLKNWWFLVIVVKSGDIFSVVTTLTLSAFHLIVYPVFFVNLAAKIRLSLGCHPVDGDVSRGGPSPTPWWRHWSFTWHWYLHRLCRRLTGRQWQATRQPESTGRRVGSYL